jgi:intracellular multiplication protein IcmO
MPLSLRQLLDLRVGGFRDNVALLGSLWGGMMASPMFSDDLYARLVGVGISAAGSYMLGNKLAEVMNPRVFDSPVKIHSDTARSVDLSRDWGGMLLGFTVDTGKPVVVSWENWMRHAVTIGQSGMGKTVLGEWLMFQQIMRGGGLIWIDAKIDADNIDKLYLMCAFAGRLHELKVVNPDNPNTSNTYNPILYGDPDEVASRILSLIPSAANNPGADHYRSSANQGVTTTVSAIQQAGYGYTFRDLSILLQSEDAMKYLAEKLPKNSDSARMYGLFLERFKTTDRTGAKILDLKKISDLFGGVGGRLFSFAEGNFGRITETYSPEVRMFEDITSNRILYFALPTMGKAEAADQFGKMAVGDYRSAIAKIQSLPVALRPWPPTLGFFDEAGRYVGQSWSAIFEQGRSAHQALCPMIQTVANLEAVSDELREMVTGSTVTKIAFRLGTSSSAEFLTDYIGTENVRKLSTSAGGGGGENASAGTGVKQSMSRNKTMSFSESMEEVLRVSLNDVKSLEKGEAVVTTDGGKVYHIKVPRISFSDEFKKSVGRFQVNRQHETYANGLRLFEKFGKAA